MSDADAKAASDFVTAIMESYPEDRKPGLVVIVMANEHSERPGGLEIRAVMEAGTAATKKGAKMLIELGGKISDMIMRAAEELAKQHDKELIPRPDLMIEVTGERPKA